MDHYDVTIIGAGPAGYVSAIRASQLGLRVTVVEKEWLGGVCLNVGCVPSKALLKNAEVAHLLRNRSREFGFAFDNLKLDYRRAVKRSRQVSRRLTKGVEFLMKKNNIDVIKGTGFISSADIVTITDSEGGKKEISSENIVIATGASPYQIPGVEIDGKNILTYREAILQEKVPSSVIIVGSGAIGAEFATIWNSYGVDVTLVEMLPRILPLEDEEISAEISKSLTKRKIKILIGHKVESLEHTENGVRVILSIDDDEKILEAEQVLIAIGFRPNSSEIGLDSIGVKTKSNGAVEIDDRMATNVPGTWAIGDVTAKLMLAHVGTAQGILCAENIAGLNTVPLDYEMMPRATYCHPQVASFGLTEAQAQERGYEIKIGRFPFQANGKALALGDYVGWVKMITDAKYGEIIGVHMIGPEVTELLPELTLAQMMELTPAEISKNVHAHPTLSEVLMETAHVLEGKAIHI